MERVVARWETRNGKHWIELLSQTEGIYYYRSSEGGGVINITRNGDNLDNRAILTMIEPWGIATGPVTVLQTDFPTLRRTV